MEIERKYLIKKLPEDLAQYPYMEMEQAYLCTEPVVRVRKEGEDYVLTYKSKGLMVREEYNLPLTKESYEHLLEKADGTVITKTRYRGGGKQLLSTGVVRRRRYDVQCVP